MIFEMRTYRLQPGWVPEAEKRFGEALTERVEVSPFGAFFHTEDGPVQTASSTSGPMTICSTAAGCARSRSRTGRPGPRIHRRDGERVRHRGPIYAGPYAASTRRMLYRSAPTGCCPDRPQQSSRNRPSRSEGRTKVSPLAAPPMPSSAARIDGSTSGGLGGGGRASRRPRRIGARTAASPPRHPRHVR